MSFAAVVRPVIDRVYVGLRHASHGAVRAVYDEYGLRPGIEVDYYFALLDHPVPVEAVAAAMVYQGFDPESEVRRGIVRIESGAWHLTERGRALALAVDDAIGAGAQALWSRRPIATMPGLDGLAVLNGYVERLLYSGQASGGPAFLGLTPVYEPPGAAQATVLASRLGALRHHRADAHRTAWISAGLTAAEMATLGPGGKRAHIEAETNRIDGAIYRALTHAECLALLGGLGALPDGLTGP